MYWNNDGHMDDGWGIAMVLSMLGFVIMALVLTALLTVWLVRSASSSPTSSGTSGTPSGASRRDTGSAEQILAERLARGDIDPDEYQMRHRLLTPSG